jgi:stage IV sporulation protein FB
MLGTSTTPYDLRFRLLDIPVRIHPLFWLISAVLGWQDHNIPAVLIWIGCVFVSILVHEFGHGLMARKYHGSPSIVLYGMGGLCYSQGERTPWQRLAVILAGPGAGFILCGLTLLGASAAFGLTGSEHLAVVQQLAGLDGNREEFVGAISKLPSETAFRIYRNLVWINLMWGLVNLLPIWPLDGGQATQVVLSMVDRKQGVRRGHIISLLTAGFLAVLAAVRGSDFFLTIFFGMFAFINFQVLQSLHQAQSFGVYHDDDWWRR